MTPLLHFDDLIKSKSLEELAFLYDKKNYISDCKLRTIKQVRKDWKEERTKLYEQAQTKRWPKEIPSVEVHTKSRIFTLLGVPETEPNPLESNLLRNALIEELPHHGHILYSPEAKPWIKEGIPIASQSFQYHTARFKAFMEGSTIIYRKVYTQTKKVVTPPQKSTSLCTMLNMSPFAWSTTLPYAELEYNQSRWFPSYTSEQQKAEYTAKFCRFYAARKNIPTLTAILPFSQIPYVTHLLQFDIAATEPAITAHEDVIHLIHKEKQYYKEIKKDENRLARAYFYGALTNLTPLLYTLPIHDIINKTLSNLPHL